MQKEELANAIGVEVSYIEDTIALGMPSYSADAARTWLIDEGYIAADTDTATTVSELSALMGVSHVTCRRYRDTPGFPEGPPYLISEVLEWDDRHNKDRKPGGAKEELDSVKLEMAKLKLKEMQGDLMDLAVVIEEMTRQNALAKQKLKRLPWLVNDILPADTADQIRDDLRRRVTKLADDMADDIAACFRENDEVADSMDKAKAEAE